MLLAVVLNQPLPPLWRWLPVSAPAWPDAGSCGAAVPSRAQIHSTASATDFASTFVPDWMCSTSMRSLSPPISQQRNRNELCLRTICAPSRSLMSFWGEDRQGVLTKRSQRGLHICSGGRRDANFRQCEFRKSAEVRRTQRGEGSHSTALPSSHGYCAVSGCVER